MIIVSACLAGVNCSYDGRGRQCDEIVEMVRQGKAIPVCPEQLGGLPTPRPCCELREGRVVTTQGVDVTEGFLRGAEEGLKIALMCGADQAVLKAGSPSCGCGEIYDGTFSGAKIAGDGLFAAILKENGIEVEACNDFKR